MTDKKQEKKEEAQKQPERVKNYFEVLNSINVQDKIEKKNNLSYLSWAYAWGELKKLHPDAVYNIKMFDGKPYLYDENLGYMVFTDLSVNGLVHEMWLPVMDGANKSMRAHSYTYDTKFGKKTVEAASMFDINKTIMRCLVKNIAMFGLGLYIYAGEDLPEDEKEANEKNAEDAPKKTKKQIAEETFKPEPVDRLEQERMRDSALTLLNACATLNKLKEIWIKNQPQWSSKLDSDLYKEIEECKDHNKAELEKGVHA